jgi:hypothetical protein
VYLQNIEHKTPQHLIIFANSLFSFIGTRQESVLCLQHGNSDRGAPLDREPVRAIIILADALTNRNTGK